MTDDKIIYNPREQDTIDNCFFLIQGSGTGDNLDELAGDDGLARAVEGEGELVDHLARVLGRVVHGRHARGLLGAGALLQRVEQHGGERELHVRLQHVGI